jgi:hypothetical protein
VEDTAALIAIEAADRRVDLVVVEVGDADIVVDIVAVAADTVAVVDTVVGGVDIVDVAVVACTAAAFAFAEHTAVAYTVAFAFDAFVACIDFDPEGNSSEAVGYSVGACTQRNWVAAALGAHHKEEVDILFWSHLVTMHWTVKKYH